MSLLAALHRDMKQVPGFERKDVERLAGIDAREELARHNQELRKIYTFVRRKNRKNEFEAAYIQCFSSIREEAERAERLLKETSYEAAFVSLYFIALPPSPWQLSPSYPFCKTNPRVYPAQIPVC